MSWACVSMWPGVCVLRVQISEARARRSSDSSRTVSGRASSIPHSSVASGRLDVISDTSGTPLRWRSVNSRSTVMRPRAATVEVASSALDPEEIGSHGLGSVATQPSQSPSSSDRSAAVPGWVVDRESTNAW